METETKTETVNIAEKILALEKELAELKERKPRKVRVVMTCEVNTMNNEELSNHLTILLGEEGINAVIEKVTGTHNRKAKGE